MKDKIEIGDRVLHKPTGESWLVCYADYETGKLAWFGWPDGLANIADCEIEQKATDLEKAYWLERCRGLHERRFTKAVEMYGAKS